MTWASKRPFRSLHGRSGLELRTMGDLDRRGVSYEYETVKVPWIEPEQKHKYTPDFILPNGIIIETKGLWDSDDRKKMKYVLEQHPDLDIRIVFTPGGLNKTISKTSKTTYRDWCIKLGIKYAEAQKQTKTMEKHGIYAHVIPQEWLDEPVEQKRIEAIRRLK